MASILPDTYGRNNANITQTFLENRKRTNTSEFINDTSVTFIAKPDKANTRKITGQAIS